MNYEEEEEVGDGFGGGEPLEEELGDSEVKFTEEEDTYDPDDRFH